MKFRFIYCPNDSLDEANLVCFEYTGCLLAQIVLDVTPPGSLRPLEIAGRVAWTRHTDGEEGIGIEFKTRDAGGTRRLKELVRRLELLEAESAMDGEDVLESA